MPASNIHSIVVVACPERTQKDILMYRVLGRDQCITSTRKTRIWLVWDTVGSYLRITLTTGTKKILTGLLKTCTSKISRQDCVLREVSKLNVVLRKGDGAVAAPDWSIWKKKSIS
jgi:hypothetical protein